MLNELMNHAYRSLRGRDLPAGTPPDLLVSLALEKSLDLLRGQVGALRYGAHQGLHLRGKRTVVRYPRGLRLGQGVVFAPDIVIEAFSTEGITLGDRVTVARGASLLASGVIREPGIGISIGQDSAVGAYNVIWGQGGVEIGRDTLLGPGVIVVSENHTYDDPALPIRMQPGSRAKIRIGDDCWIGAGVRVLAGVEIGDHSVVGAGAVVTRSLPPYSIAVGVPARTVGARTPIGLRHTNDL